MRRNPYLVAAAALIILAVTGLLLAVPRTTTAGPPPPIYSYDPINPGEKRLVAVPGEVLVKFKSGVPAATRSSVLRAQKATLVTSLLVPGYYLLKVKEVELDTVPKTVGALARDPAVAAAQPNYYRYADATPNDPFYAYQWNLSQIQMADAWDVTRGSRVTVAVVDTGIAYENYGSFRKAPDLAGTTFVAGWNFVNNTAHANDDNSHGTHVAGTIAQTTDNNLGAAGIAYQARLMPLKVLGADGAGTDAAVASAMIWAADHGANVINMSLGADSASSVLQDAVDYAYAKGLVLVAAAGNGGVGSINYPGACSHVIAVGAVRYDETKVPYSNYGTGLALVAPGGDLSVDQNGDGYPDGVLQMTFNPTTKNIADFAYWFFQGTSMATPHVSGVAALVLAKGAAATPAQVLQALQATTKDLGEPGWDPMFGYGLLQARTALDWTPSFTGTATPTPTRGSPAPAGTPTASVIQPTSSITASAGTPTRTRTASPTQPASSITAITGTATRTRTASPTQPASSLTAIAGTTTRTPTASPTQPTSSLTAIAGTATRTASVARTQTATRTASITQTASRTSTATRTATPTRTRTTQANTPTRTPSQAVPVQGLRFSAGIATRSASLYQCTSDGLRQRVWRVDASQTSATYLYTRPLPAGVTCGSSNHVYGQSQLTISGGSMTPNVWVTQCVGAGGVRLVWRAGSDGRNMPFLYPEQTRSCP
jgi:serine protease